MTHYVLIDGNNVAFQTQAAGMSKRSRSKRLFSGEQETTAIFGLLQTMRELQCKWPEAKLAVLWDEGEIWRYKIYPEYKGNRKENPEIQAIKDALRPQRPFIKPLLDAAGIPQIEAPDYEADDIAGFMAHALSKSGHQVTLVSRDGDWLQLVDERVQVYNKFDDRMTTQFTFEANTGCATTDLFVEMKMLLGDNSDNIPGAKGIGPVAAGAIFETFGSISAMIEQFPAWVESMPKGHPLSRPRKAIERLIESPEALRDLRVRNRVLMDLRAMRGNKKLASRFVRTRGVVNHDFLNAELPKLGMFSIVKDLRRWLAPFAPSNTQ